MSLSPDSIPTEDSEPVQDSNNLQVPSTQQARRKRGLSLRSQLFNKALATRLISPSYFGSDIELDKIPASGEPSDLLPQAYSPQSSPPQGFSPQFPLGEPAGLPQITVEETEDASISKHRPYNTYNLNLSRSTTHLTAGSLTSDLSSIEFLTRMKSSRRGKISRVITKIINKITGNEALPPTENGRVIPITFASDINYEFSTYLCDPHSKSLIDERNGQFYCSNAIASSKYTIYTFLPKQLRAQFSKVANCYFMVVAIMQMIPSWSTTGKFTTIIPLLIFISISAAREGYDDWKRHVHDKEENNRRCTIIKEDELDISTMVINSSNPDLNTTLQALSDNESSSHSEASLRSYNLKETTGKWKNIKVGDIIKVREDEWIPADILLLSAYNETEPEIAYIETMDLDGETNLKSKFSPPDLSSIMAKSSGLKNFSELVTVEDPNTDLYNFEGLLNVKDESIALGPDNVIYRGSVLRNTKSVLGLVIFTGEETKIRMNNIKNPRTKAPKLQRNINYIVIFMVLIVASLSAFSMMAEKILHTMNKDKAWYLYGQDAGTAATLMGFIIMYNTLIPLSLYVTMEIIKVGQLLLLQCDIDMYHAESNTPADAKTATILEELGQVSYIFSDKTGTLTDNLMLFRKFSVNGVSWLHDIDCQNDTKVEDVDTLVTLPRTSKTSFHYNNRKSTTSYIRQSMDTINSSSTWKSTANPKKIQGTSSSLKLLKYVQENPNTLFAKKAKFFLLSIALCSTCLPRRKHDVDSSSSQEEDETLQDDDQDLEYQASSPDEKALVEAARDLGFVVFDKKNNTLTVKTYPNGFKSAAKYEEYQVLDIIEFSSARKRMSIIVRFPDNRICVICKGADNVIIEKLKNYEMAKNKAKEISVNASERKMMEADVVLLERFSQEAEARASIGSLSSLRKSLHASGPDRAVTMNSIDNYLAESNVNEGVNDVAERARRSLHLQQAQRYSLDASIAVTSPTDDEFNFDDRLLVNDEYLIEKTLEHIEEFSTEGLRTLLYSYRWLDKEEYEVFSQKYQAAKTALVDRSKQVEDVGQSIEKNLELLGATAIEDKLQDGVSDAIEKLRRAGIKMWMLTGDKRETAINIGYSCRLIKDYSDVVILNIDQGKEEVKKAIMNTTKKVNGGSIAHCVVVIDGATLGEIQDDENLMHHLIDLCVVADSVICCRASPSQKATMVTAIRDLNKKSVTLAIGDGANDIAMIQSADIGVGITGKEGLQAARASDYSIAQFRFLLKLLLVNGRYNYVRTAKFVLCTFYKELIFYLTQAVYQRQTLFSGSSVYESWSLSMYNTLFTSLPVLVVGIFDKDLKPATLLAVPELYAKGRLYQGFNLKVFVSWMVLAALQSVGISFLTTYLWGFHALRDNTTLPLGTLMFAALVILINAKCEFVETQNRTWIPFAAFIISVGGYGLWNVLIMGLYRSKSSTIFYVDYGLLEFGRDISWWATLLVVTIIPLYLDILIKVFKFIIKPSDDEVFKAIEKDIEMRKVFEEKAFSELKQGWLLPEESSIWYKRLIAVVNYVLQKLGTNIKLDDLSTSEQRKRAGTETNPHELPPGSEGTTVVRNDSEFYELPSGKRVKKKKGIFSRFKEDEDVEAIIADRLEGISRK